MFKSALRCVRQFIMDRVGNYFNHEALDGYKRDWPDSEAEAYEAKMIRQAARVYSFLRLVGLSPELPGEQKRKALALNHAKIPYA